MKQGRFLAAFGCLFVFAGIAHVQKAAASAPTQKPVIDAKAMALLDRSEANLLSIKTLTADHTVRRIYPSDSRHPKVREMRDYDQVRLMKPNYSWVDGWIEDRAKNGAWDRKSLHSVSLASDGKTRWLIFNDDQTYQKQSTGPHGMNVDSVMPIDGFFDKSNSFASWVMDPQQGQLISLKYIGTSTWEGKPYRIVEWRYYPSYNFGAETLKRVPGGKMIETQDIYIGANDIPLRMTSKYNIGWYIDDYLENVKIDSPMTKASFAYKPPAGYHPPQPPPALLANGTPAPDFTVHDAAGNPVKLSDYRGKVVILDFWATWCGPCQEGLPGTNQVAKEYKDKNVVVLAVNIWDTSEAFKSWLPQHKDFDSLVFTIDPTKNNKDVASLLYKVSGIPTQYVIDPSGKIVASFVGYNPSEKPLEDAIHSVGAS